MLYPREDKEERKLIYACRNCDHRQDAAHPCIYKNRLTHEIEYVFLLNNIRAELWQFLAN